jgi:hypothetical protein
MLIISFSHCISLLDYTDIIHNNPSDCQRACHGEVSSIKVQPGSPKNKMLSLAPLRPGMKSINPAVAPDVAALDWALQQQAVHAPAAA